jgi:hypothetical protein
MKVTIIMGTPDKKKHSTKFDAIDVPEDLNPGVPLAVRDSLRKASFYIPLPFGGSSARIKVTLEEVAG